MADRIKVNTEILERIMQRLSELESDLERAQSILNSVDVSLGSLDDLSIRTDDSGGKVLFPQAIETLNHQTGAAGNFAKQTGDALRKSIRLFDEAEQRISQTFDASSQDLAHKGDVQAPASEETAQAKDMPRGKGIGAILLGGFEAPSPKNYTYGSGVSRSGAFWEMFKGMLPFGAPGIDAAVAQQRQAHQDYESYMAEWESMRKKYDETLNQRLENAVHEDTRRVYEKYQSKIRVLFEESSITSGTFNPAINAIMYNWLEDYENTYGVGTTYYHESGHAIDDFMTLTGHASSSRAFSEALRADFNRFVEDVSREHGNCSREKAYEHIRSWLGAEWQDKQGVADLLEGLSGGAINVDGGHDPEYWKGDQHGVPEALNNEAFAHFFEAGMCTDDSKLEHIKKVFPTAYPEFEKLLKADLAKK